MKRLSFLFFMMMALGFTTAAWAQQTLTVDWDLFASNPGGYAIVELNTNSVTVSTNVTNNIAETNNYIGGTVGHGKGSTVKILGCVYISSVPRTILTIGSSHLELHSKER